VRFVLRGAPVLAAALWIFPAPASAGPLPPDLGKLTYYIEWRLIHAGDAVIDLHNSDGRMKLDSAGLVSALFKVDDAYTVRFEPSFCAGESQMDSKEGKRHRQTTVTYDRNQNRATWIERDVLDNNKVLRRAQVDIPHCVHDVLGGLLTLRGSTLEPGQSTLTPMSDGRRSAQVKVDAQEREQVTTPAGTFKTIRYEVNLLNGVVYPRKGRAFVWVSDDARRIPVQIRLRLAFPIGTVTLQLQKEEAK
jgi:Protein of unknown function (DUF3108)